MKRTGQNDTYDLPERVQHQHKYSAEICDRTMVVANVIGGFGCVMLTIIGISICVTYCAYFKYQSYAVEHSHPSTDQFEEQISELENRIDLLTDRRLGEIPEPRRDGYVPLTVRTPRRGDIAAPVGKATVGQTESGKLVFVYGDESYAYSPADLRHAIDPGQTPN